MYLINTHEKKNQQLCRNKLHPEKTEPHTISLTKQLICGDGVWQRRKNKTAFIYIASFILSMIKI